MTELYKQAKLVWEEIRPEMNPSFAKAAGFPCHYTKHLRAKASGGGFWHLVKYEDEFWRAWRDTISAKEQVGKWYKSEKALKTYVGYENDKEYQQQIVDLQNGARSLHQSPADRMRI